LANFHFQFSIVNKQTDTRIYNLCEVITVEKQIDVSFFIHLPCY